MDKQRLVQSLALGVTSECVNKLVPLAILFFVVRRLGVGNFGFAQFGFWLIDVAIIFIVFGYHHYAAIEIGRVSGNKEKIKDIVGEVLGCKILHALLAMVMIAATVLWLPQYQKYAPIAFALFFLLITSAIDLNFLHIGTQRMQSWSLILIGVKVISLVLVLLFVTGPEDTIEYAVFTLGANGAVSLFALYYNRQFLPRSWPSRIALYQRLKGSLPMAAYILLLVGIERVDIFFVEAFAGVDGLGIYSGAVRLVMTFIPLVTALTSIFFSEVIAQPGRESLTKHLRLSAVVVFTIVVPLGICAWFLDREILSLLLGVEFAQASTVFSILCLSLIPYSVIHICGWQTLMTMGRVKELNISLAFGFITCLIGCFALGPILSLSGFALSSLLGKSVAATLCAYFARKEVDELPWKALRNTFFPVVITTVVLVVLSEQNLILKIAIAGICYGTITGLRNRNYIMPVVDKVRGRWLKWESS